MHFTPEELSSFMTKALEAANKAASENEVPIGCILVDIASKEILSTASNKLEQSNDPTSHAEILAIQSAALNKKNWRLDNAALFVTVEPCTMCVGAIIQARIPLVVFGCIEPKTGAAGSCYDLLTTNGVRVIQGIREEACKNIIQSFFKARRQ